MRLLIASAVNQIGFFALPEAQTRGHDVVATRHRSRFVTDPVETKWVDAPEDFAPDGLIYLGPLPYVADLVEKLAPRGLKAAVAIGSASIHFKGNSQDPHDQRLIANLRKGEQAFADVCASHGISATLLRPTLIYGCGLDNNVTTLVGMIKQMPVLPVPLGAHGLRQPVHARDLAKLAILAVEAAKPGFHAYDAPGGERLGYSAMLRRLAAMIGFERHIMPVPGLIALYKAARHFGFLQSGPAPVQLERMCSDLAVDGTPAMTDFGGSRRVSWPAGAMI